MKTQKLETQNGNIVLEYMEGHNRDNNQLYSISLHYGKNAVVIDKIDLNDVPGAHLIGTIPDGFLLNQDGDYDIKCLVLPNALRYMDGCAFSRDDLKARKIVWSPNCDHIPDWVFAGNPFIEKLDNIDHVTSIGPGAFQNCPNIKEFTVPDGVQHIHRYCFSDSGLLSIKGLDHVVNIDQNAFSNCKVESFDWPASCTYIDVAVFDNCHNLKKISGLDHVFKIGPAAFRNCGLEYLDLSKSLCSHIGDHAFCNCPNLKKAVFGYWLKEIAENAFDGTNAIITGSPLVEDESEEEETYV